MKQEGAFAWLRSADLMWGTGAVVLSILLALLLLNSPGSVAAPVITAPAANTVLTPDAPAVLAGRAAPHQPLSIEGNGRELGQTTADADGQFRYQLPDLAPGVYEVVVAAVDDGGEPLAMSAPLSLEVAAPVASVEAAPAGRDLQISLPAGGLSFDIGDVNVLAGTGAPGATVRLLNGEATIGEALVDSSGAWKLKLPRLDPGMYSLTLKQIAPGGEETILPKALDISLSGLQPPELALPAGGLSFAVGEPATIEGTGIPGAAITLLAGDESLGTTVVDANGAWAITLPELAEGAHSFLLKQTTAEGQEVLLPEGVTVSIGLPEGTSVSLPGITQPAGGLSFPSGQPVTLTGTGAPGATVSVLSGSETLGETVVDANGNWTLQIPALDPGEYDLTLKQATPEGQETALPGAAKLTVGDAAAASSVPAVIQPAEGLSFAAGQAVTLEGTGAPGATISVLHGAEQLGESVADTAGSWAVSLPALDPGNYSLTIRQTGQDGAQTTAPEPVAVTVLPPAPVITSPASDVTLAFGSPLPVAGSGLPGATVSVREGAETLSEGKVDADGEWSLEIPSLALGEHELSAVQTTADGAVSAVAGPFTVFVSAPPLALLGAAPVAVRPGRTVQGTAPAGLDVLLFSGDEQLGTAQADEQGNWQFALPADLAPTIASLDLRAVDATGNLVSQAESAVIFGAPETLPVTGGRSGLRLPRFSPALGSRGGLGEPIISAYPGAAP